MLTFSHESLKSLQIFGDRRHHLLVPLNRSDAGVHIWLEAQNINAFKSLYHRAKIQDSTHKFLRARAA